MRTGHQEKFQKQEVKASLHGAAESTVDFASNCLDSNFFLFVNMKEAVGSEKCEVWSVKCGV